MKLGSSTQALEMALEIYQSNGIEVYSHATDSGKKRRTKLAAYQCGWKTYWVSLKYCVSGYVRFANTLYSQRGEAGLNEGLVGEYRGEEGLKDGDCGE